MSSKKQELEFEARLRQFFVEMAAVKGPRSRNFEDVDEFIFHVKDCIENLRHLCELHDKPLLFEQEEANKIMEGVVYHAVPHLIAAARLYDFVPDIFKESYLNSKRNKRNSKEKPKRTKLRVKT